LYIQKAIANMYATNCISRPFKRRLDCRAGRPSSVVTSGDAGGAIHYAAGVALGKTINYYEGAPAINAFFTSLAGGTANPAVIYIPSSDYDAANGISVAEGNALTAHATDIKNFVNSGGGLMAHVDGTRTSGWITTVLGGGFVVTLGLATQPARR